MNEASGKPLQSDERVFQKLKTFLQKIEDIKQSNNQITLLEQRIGAH